MNVKNSFYRFANQWVTIIDYYFALIIKHSELFYHAI